jgi:hypothetical protein
MTMTMTHSLTPDSLDEQPEPLERSLTPQLRDTLADQAILGMGSAELAELHQVDVAKMRRWLSADSVRQRVEERRERLLAMASRAHFRFLMVADDLARAQVNEALDPSSPNQYKARTYILDRVLPTRHAVGGEQTINVQINNQVLGELAAAVQGANSARLGGTSGSPMLIAGKDALPPING